MGFGLADARAALELHGTVGAAVEALLPYGDDGAPGSGVARADAQLPPAPPPRPPAVRRVAASRGPAPTAAEWGGGLGEVLRPPAGGSSAAEAARSREERERPAGAPARAERGLPQPRDEYYELMQMHLRDNVEGAPAQKAWQQDWRCVLKLLKTVRPPPRARGARAGGRAGASCCTDADSVTEASGDTELCSICIEPLHVAGPVPGGFPVCALPCKHAFHRKCLTECVKRGHWTCPNCRDDLRLRLE